RDYPGEPTTISYPARNLGHCLPGRAYLSCPRAVARCSPSGQTRMHSWAARPVTCPGGQIFPAETRLPDASPGRAYMFPCTRIDCPAVCLAGTAGVRITLPPFFLPCWRSVALPEPT